jgi:uncharacterized protein Yka (UPF0111/DUF47 family)
MMVFFLPFFFNTNIVNEIPSSFDFSQVATCESFDETNLENFIEKRVNSIENKVGDIEKKVDKLSSFRHYSYFFSLGAIVSIYAAYILYVISTK